MINSGTVVVATDAQFSALNFNGGTLGGPVLVRSNCVMNWNNGVLAGGSLTVESNAVVNLQTSNTKHLDGPMTNSGSVLWTGGTFHVRNNNSAILGRVVNRGLWQMQGDLDLAQWFGNALEVFVNNGTFRKSSGTGVGIFSVSLQNEFGAVDIQSGTLRFDRGQQLDGLFITAAGAVIQFNSGTFTYTALTQLTGAGQYQLTSNATLLGLLDYLPNLKLFGGSVGLSPNYQTNGNIVRLDLDGSTLIGSNRVTGVLNLNSTSGGVFGSVTISSNAVLNWNAGTVTAALTVESNGVVNLRTGSEKNLDGPMLNSGSVIWTGGGFNVRNNNVGNLGGVVNLGLWQMQGDLDLKYWFGTGFEKFINGGTFRKVSGSGISIVSVTFLNEFGNVEVQSGVVRFDRGTQLDGFFLAALGATIQFNTGTFNYTPLTRLTGAGLYQLTGGTLQGLLDYLPNLQLVGGSVLLAPTYQTNGTIARLDLNGSTLASSNRVSGVLNLISGRISGSLVVDSNAVLNWYGGRFDGVGLTVESNGVANLLGGQKDLAGCLTNAGQVVWSAGTITVFNNASTLLGAVENQPGGSWDIQGDFLMNQFTPNNYAAFRNRGLLKKSAGTGTASLDLPFYNLGTLKQLSGILDFGRDLSLYAGSVVFGIASNGFGRINLVGTASLGGNLGVELLGGFIPNSNTTYQVMSYGVSAGAFTNYDGLNVGFGRYFTPVYTPTTLTLQAAGTNGPNSAPSLSPISNATIIERTTLVLANTANDPNGDQILFSFVSAPTNATLGLTTGLFSWTPTEAQGNTTNLITLRAFDSGSPSLSATQSFTVTVIKTNHAPVLPQIAAQLIGVGGTLTVINIAVDVDAPTNLLTYALLGAPLGVTITNGIITWSPSNSGSFQLTTRVTGAVSHQYFCGECAEQTRSSVRIGELLDGRRYNG